jgi:ANTAR domain
VPFDPPSRTALRVLAEALHAGRTGTGQALELLVRGALDTLPGWQYASISTQGRGGDVQTLTATVDWIDRCDQLQAELGEGPCFDTMAEESYFFAEDLQNDGRWPRYAPRVLELGIRAQGAVVLASARRRRASLNLYASHPIVVDSELVDLARLYAANAGGVLGLLETVGQLQIAAHSRQRIGQAVGVVMERYRLNEDQAFRFLVRSSQETNRKLRDVADEIVRHSGAHPSGVSDPR